MQQSFFLFLITVLFLASCKKKEQEEQSAAETSFSTYKVIYVQGGGSISGTVEIPGGTAYPKTISIERDQPACGASHPNPSVANGSLAGGCVVWIEGIKEGKDFKLPPQHEVDQNGCAFVPHVSIMRTGGTVIVHNSDNTLHNFHVTNKEVSLVNEAQPEGAPPRELKLEKPGLNTVVCDVHPWMKGFIWVVDHPYYTITDSLGHFSLDDVPAGTYKLHLWRDNWNIEELKNGVGKIVSYKWQPDITKETDAVVVSGKDVVVKFALP
jgi:plastocyanin